MAISNVTDRSAGSRIGIQEGTHTFGPENGVIWIKTGRAGAAAQAGHDLLIQVTAWQGTLDVGKDSAQTSVTLDVDATSLRVRDGSGGMQALGDDDKASIEETIDDEVLKRMNIEFRSTAVQALADGSRIVVQGDLTLLGNVRPLGLELAVGDDGSLSGSVTIKQTDWGMTPYSTLFGALKVADEVEVVFNASLAGTAPGAAAEGLEWSAPWALEWHPTPIIDPGISSFIWSLVFFLFLWFGMAAVGVSHSTALTLALVASFFIFLFVRTHGVGREADTPVPPSSDSGQSR